MNKLTNNRYTFLSVAILASLAIAAGIAGDSTASSEATPKVLPITRSVTDALLPGDGVIGPAALNQENPQIAAGGGGYLMVWEDSRTNYLGYMDDYRAGGGDPGGQTYRDIYAVRLDAIGQPVDMTPIILSEATWSQTVPQVAWNGQNWLVVWNTERIANSTSTIDIVGVRVSPQGVVLDSQPIQINGSPTIDELWPTVASDGTNWLVVWMDIGSYYELDGARVAPDGSVLDPGGVPIHTPQFPYAPYNPSITFAGDEYLLIWGDGQVRGLRVSPTVQPIGSVFTIGEGYSPELYSNGTDFFVAWPGISGTRVTHAGQVLDPNGINISGSNTGLSQPDVGWDGTQWVVTWVSHADNTYVGRVTTGGVVLDPNGVFVSGSSMVSAVAGQPGGGARVVWTDYHAAGLIHYDIYAAGVSAQGVAGPTYAASLGAPSQRQPDLAPSGSGYLAVFASEVSGEMSIKAQRLDASGNAIDQEPIFIATSATGTIGIPAVAWNGSLYLVVWEDVTTGPGWVPGIIYGKRIQPDGTVIDTTPINIMPGNSPDVEAMGDTFLVADTYEPTNHNRYAQSVRVRGTDGAVLGSPVALSNAYSRSTSVAVLGSRWLVVWQINPTHDDPNASIAASFVNQDGSTAGQFDVTQWLNYRTKTPNVASKGDQAMIVFYSSIGTGEIRARRILPDGTLLDGSTGLAVTSAPDTQFAPAVTWDGSEYVVGYEDYRNVPYLDLPVSDIYATRVGANGTVLDPNGVVVSNRPAPEVQVVLAALPALGNYIISFADFMDSSPYDAYRIIIQSYQANITPTPQPTRTNTPIPPTATPICGPNGDYVFTQSAGAPIVPGVTDIGNHCDDCDTTLALPFPFLLYGHMYNSVLVTSNGTMNFVTTNGTGFINFCLPYSPVNEAIIPYWRDMRTDGSNYGIFTSISGSAPNRIFNIEWRTGYFGNNESNFEVRLYENSPIERYDVIYGLLSDPGTGATVGMQRDTGSRYTQYECNTGGLQEGLQLSFAMNDCGSVTPVPSNTPVQPTDTPVPPTSATGVPTSTPTAPASQTVTSTPTSPVLGTGTPTVCSISFGDVLPGSTFYPFIQCLACQGIISGYPDNTFRPSNPVTRGQAAKIMANAAGYAESIPPTQQTFTDVPPDSTFWVYIERVALHGAINGYPDGTYRPGNNMTRGQLSKVDSEVKGYNDAIPPMQQTFLDVVPGTTFWVYIERVALHAVVSGYPDGTFRPNNDVTRGQASKIVSNTFFPECGAQ